MHSSTSSSERQAPPGNWTITWIAALAIGVAATMACERWLRAHGQRPSVVDDPVRWALKRQEVGDDAKTIAFVGTSRLLLGLSVAEIEGLVPGYKPVQLAINGGPAEHVLADLAADEDFRGIAVVDVDEWDIAWGDATGVAIPYVERAHSLWRAPGAVANRVLATAPQEQLASLAIGGRSFLVGVSRGRPPKPAWIVYDRDRVGYGDFSVVSAATVRAKARARDANFATPSPPPDAWLERALAIETHVARIRARGGDVVIVRMPISGRLAELFAQHYPRQLYWDRFAARSTAHVIHFADVPAMNALHCPDEMHLDYQQQPAFTRALVTALRERGLLR